VMREVLSRLIGSSFKSGAVLKRLEVGETRRHDYWLETMKVYTGTGTYVIIKPVKYRYRDS
jgi:hypothetical protein